jgi:hypothetical protein
MSRSVITPALYGEIKTLLKRLKNHKAPSPNEITNLVLKNLPRMVLL